MPADEVGKRTATLIEVDFLMSAIKCEVEAWVLNAEFVVADPEAIQLIDLAGS